MPGVAVRGHPRLTLYKAMIEEIAATAALILVILTTIAACAAFWVGLRLYTWIIHHEKTNEELKRERGYGWIKINGKWQ